MKKPVSLPGKQDLAAALNALLETAAAPDNQDAFLRKVLDILASPRALGPKAGLLCTFTRETGKPPLTLSRNLDGAAIKALSGARRTAPPGTLCISSALTAAGAGKGRLTAVIPGRPDRHAAAELLRSAAHTIAARLSQESRDAQFTKARDVMAAVTHLEEFFLSIPGLSLEEVTRSMLDEASRLTGSSLGFAGYIDPATGWLHIPTLTGEAWTECGRDIILKEFSGLWGMALRNKKPLVNNAASACPVPEGMLKSGKKIKRFLAVPAVSGKKLIGILALADPPADYTEDSLYAIQRLARVYALMLRNKLEELQRGKDEAKYSSIIASSHDVIYTLSLEGRITYISPRVSDYGYKPEDLVGKGFRDVLHPDDFNKVAAAFEEALKAGHTRPDLTFRIRNKAGEYRTVEQRSNIAFIDGKPAFFTGILRDVTAYRRTETLLEESELKQRALFENANAAIFVADTLTGKVLDTNKKGEALLGMERAEILSRTKLDMHPQEKRALYKRLFERHLKAPGRQHSYEGEVLRKDGSTVPVRIRSSYLRLGGRLVVQGIFEDISEPKRVYDAMQESEARFRAMFESSRDALMVLAVPGYNFCQINRAASEMLGLKYGEELGAKVPWDFCPEKQRDGEDSREKGSRFLAEAVANGSANFEWAFTDGKGRTFPVEVMLTRMELNGQTVIQACLRDLSEQRKIIQMLRDSEALMRLIFETSTDPMFIKDINGMYMRVNNACAQAYLTTQDQILGKTDIQLYGEETGKILMKEDREVLRCGKPSTFIKELPLPSGKAHLSVVKSPLIGPHGDVIGLMGVARDISSLKKLEKHLAVAQAAAAISRVARPMAHDFNNALAAINGYATMIDDDLKEASQLKEEVGCIIKAVERAAELTSKFQDFARNPKIDDKED